MYAAPLPASTKSKMRDGRLVDHGMYAKSLRSLCKRLDGVGDDAPKFVTSQRKAKNKKTISDNESILLHSSDADLNDENVDLLPSDANYHDSYLSSLCPARDVDTELSTLSQEV